jgi:hypothetical protein
MTLAADDLKAVATILAAVDRSLPPERVEPFWRALEHARLRADIRRASHFKPGPRLRALQKARLHANKLLADLEDGGFIDQEVSAVFPPGEGSFEEGRQWLRDFAKHCADRERELERAGFFPLGRPKEQLIGDLARVASDFLDISPTAPARRGEAPAGPLVEFMIAVFRCWGEAITPDAVKSAIYRKS